MPAVPEARHQKQSSEAAAVLARAPPREVWCSQNPTAGQRLSGDYDLAWRVCPARCSLASSGVVPLTSDHVWILRDTLGHWVESWAGREA